MGLEAVDVGREGVECFDALLLCFVLCGEFLCFGNHTVNLLLAEMSLVGSGDLHDTVGVDLERDLDLGNTTGSRRNVSELELAEKVVILGQRTFTLEDLDQDGGLVVGGSGDDLALAGRDDSVTGDKLGHDTTDGLDAESEGVYIDKDDITQALVAGEDTTLNGGTVGNDLIRVDTLGGLLPEVLLEELLDLGDTSGTTNENDLKYTSARLND